MKIFLKSYQGGILAVSHDHELVKNAATKIIKIQGQSIIEL
ncbi:hypothetical protein Q757_03705 [Oenococcus alcoholitolerans]|uniref:ABC transporter ATP-binding protein n=1 Tax=Oenococcus alcoholitolerans TaxID=931074 RepID=A0ABR4XRS9_9LACO|nr:hypothetical protein Q757_03705 [Oenococcus alcoholitolerans]